MDRSQNYRNVWNPATGYMHPREMDGSWIEDFSPVVDDFSARGFCEANSAIYSHYVPHDLPGLMELFGGRQAYLDSLNTSFERAAEDWLRAADKVHAANWVDYGNQPGTAMAHLFNVAGAPWLSQRWVRAIKDIYADTTAYGGYHGDEDQGQMGALGVLLATGLFSVNGSAAVEPSYEVTTPVFGEVVFHLHPDYYGGERFTIRTVGQPERDLYIQSATLNGRPWSSVHLPFVKVAAGGVLELRIGEQPNTKWGAD